jgi:hypothetical protein
VQRRHDRIGDLGSVAGLNDDHGPAAGIVCLLVRPSSLPRADRLRQLLRL